MSTVARIARFPRPYLLTPNWRERAGIHRGALTRVFAEGQHAHAIAGFDARNRRVLAPVVDEDDFIIEAGERALQFLLKNGYVFFLVVNGNNYRNRRGLTHNGS